MWSLVEADLFILNTAKLREVEVAAYSRLYTDHNYTSDVAFPKILVSLWIHVSIGLGQTHTIAARILCG